MSRPSSRSREPGGRAVDYEFVLPPELIATHPAAKREESRLLVYDRAKDRVEHRHFFDLPEYLGPDDLLVLNDSKVRPAAIATTDGRLEVLLLEETSPRHWVALVKPGARAKPYTRLTFGTTEKPLEAEVLTTLPGGERVLRFFGELDLDAFGEMPVPPYIRKQRKALGESEHAAEDFQRYQTVYANQVGSVAAPTAGLHFTPELLARFNHAFVTLHVGLGTFRPVKVEFLADHEMHEEVYSIPEGFEAAYEKAQRVVAVGTTSARVLESSANLRPGKGRTHIFIHPPYEFRRVDALLTNFHLPHSTLLMLVSALVGREKLLKIYREAIAQKYRFFSYGDAMLILMSRTASAKIALALTWDGARWPVASLPPKARAFLRAKGFAAPTRREAARLLAADAVGELRLCWVPRLKGGDDVLAEVFSAPKGKRVPFRAVKTSQFGDVLGVVYRR